MHSGCRLRLAPVYSHTGRRGRTRGGGGRADGDGGREEVVEEKRGFAPNADVRVWGRYVRIESVVFLFFILFWSMLCV